MSEFDSDADAANRRQGWEGFVKVSTYSTIAVVAILVFLAIFRV